MNYYHLWFDLRPGVDSRTFPQRVHDYLDYLREQELIAGWKLTRRKFGFGPAELGEWHAIVEVEDLHQLERAFGQVTRAFNPDHTVATGSADPAHPPHDPRIESLHFPVYSAVQGLKTALYRDYPDVLRGNG